MPYGMQLLGIVRKSMCLLRQSYIDIVNIGYKKTLLLTNNLWAEMYLKKYADM